MPKYGNFENHPVSLKSLPVEQKYAQLSPPPPRDINTAVYVQLLELWPIGQVSCPNMAILKLVYLGNLCLYSEK